MNKCKEMFFHKFPQKLMIWYFHILKYCHHVKQYLRLRLGGVISQGNIFALDFVETLLTEVVPVSKKPIFW